MPARGTVRVSDVPVDVLVTLAREGQEGLERLCGEWVRVKEDALTHKANADMAAREADKRRSLAESAESALAEARKAHEAQKLRDLNDIEGQRRKNEADRVSLANRTVALDEREAGLNERDKALKEKTRQSDMTVRELDAVASALDVKNTRLNKREEDLAAQKAKLENGLRDLNDRIQGFKGFQISE